jgi:hypothetical protein
MELALWHIVFIFASLTLVGFNFIIFPLITDVLCWIDDRKSKGDTLVIFILKRFYKGSRNLDYLESSIFKFNTTFGLINLVLAIFFGMLLDNGCSIIILSSGMFKLILCLVFLLFSPLIIRSAWRLIKSKKLLGLNVKITWGAT